MNKAPVFQHRHYKAIADLIAGMPDMAGYNPAQVRASFIGALMLTFERDNERFDRARFLAAANGKPSNGRDKVRS